MAKFINLPTHNETHPKRSSGVTVGDLTFATVTALDPETGRSAAADMAPKEEVAFVFSRADEVLAQAGLTRKDLVKATCWIASEDERIEILTAYRAQCAEGVFPQRITMSVGLPADCRVAIEFIASPS